MANEVAANHGRPAKRCRLAGSVSYGTVPPKFIGDNNKERMIFHIHDFAELKEKRGERFFTNTIEACGHQWQLDAYPRGNDKSGTTAEYVSIYLHYAGGNIETHPITARACFRTKKKTHSLDEHKYWKGVGRGFPNFKKRADIIREDLDDHGTLTINVDIEVATPVPVKTAVWYPNMSKNDDGIGPLLYRSINETSDVSFLVGKTEKTIKAHKVVLAVRAKDLFGLIVTEEESSSSSSNDPIQLVLPDVDAEAFETLLEFVYNINKEPLLEEEDDDDANKAVLLEKGKKILRVADRYGCTGLKLYIESFLVDKVLYPSNAAGLLLFADSFICPLLKEACMNIYKNDSKSFIGNGDNEESATTAAVYWKQLQESTKLLTELLLYCANDSGRTKYSSVTGDGDGTLDDADEYDVTSLRERLEKYGLDMDGSQEILLQRWKDHKERDRTRLLSKAALSRKTVKQLQEFLLARNVSTSDDDGKPLRKAGLLAAATRVYSLQQQGR